MNDVVSLQAYDALKHCPECGKELEVSPISGWKACFLHGDFLLRDGVITWDFTKHLIKRG